MEHRLLTSGSLRTRRTNKSSIFDRQLPLLVWGIVALSSCTIQDYSLDSTRAARARADSLRALGPGGWSDDELLAYMSLVSLAIVADGPVVERRSRSVAVRTFVRSMVATHHALVDSAEVFIQGRTPPVAPTISAATFRQHETTMRRLEQRGPFDLAYIRQLHATLMEAIARLDQARVPSRPATVVRLLDRARMNIRAQLGTVAELERALERGQAPAPAPGTDATNPTRRG